MKTSAEKFWYGWLKIAAILCSFFGIFLVFFNQSPAFNFLSTHIEKIFYPSSDFANQVATLQGWLISVLGATLTGWGVCMLYLILNPLQRRELWAWNAITISLILWFSLDTWISAKYGAAFNVITNIIFMLQFMAPLLFLRNSMLKVQPE